MQATKGLHHLQPRPKPQVKGVTQNDLRAHVVQAARRDALDRAVGSHRHKHGRLHLPVRQLQHAAAGVAAGVLRGGVKHTHGLNCKNRAQA